MISRLTCVVRSSGSSSTASTTASHQASSWSVSSRRSTSPSSVAMMFASTPKVSRILADASRAHGAVTRAPHGACTTIRQSPISSRKRSTSTRRSVGSTPVAPSCSLRYAMRFSRANVSRSVSASRRAGDWASASRRNAPIAAPISAERPCASACQKGSLPGRPGAGVTRTRSKVISSIRHDEAPREMTSPTRDSYTISSSSSPTRPSLVPAMNTGNRPRSGIVPPEITAVRWAPARAVRRSAVRSQTRRGRNCAKSSDG